MKIRKKEYKTFVTFSYLEWVEAGKALPQLPNGFEINGNIKYIINNVPEDKKEFFEKFGWKVVLYVSKGKGMLRNM